MDSRAVVGCMTGTSLDALDAALVEIEGRGLAMRARVLRGVSVALGPGAEPLRALASGARLAAGEVARAARDLALRHVAAVREAAGSRRLDLVAAHGQTVYHAPPLSWQLLNPAPIVEALGTSLVFDLRSADLARGGQGAPITPLADWIFLGHHRRAIAVANLGGFCNVTLVGPHGRDPSSVADLRGFDVCACNQVLDSIARECLGTPFDEGGRAALAGAPLPAAGDELNRLLQGQGRAGRSLGTGDEGRAWIERWKPRASGPDLAATACDAIARAIARRLDRAAGDGPVAPDVIALAGGGLRNAGLRRAIEARSTLDVRPSDDLGLDSAFREAACVAVLGALAADRVPFTLPGVTGVPDPAPISGVWMHP